MLLNAKLRAWCRRQAGARYCPVLVIPGGSPPTAVGLRAYKTFRRSGTVSSHPGSAWLPGHRFEYHPSTYRVEVGEDWIRLLGLIPRLLREFPPPAPAEVVADWLEEQGDVGAAGVLRRHGWPTQ